MSHGQSHHGYSVLLREIESLRVESGVTGIALVLLGLKGMREVNGTLGYVAGDRMLEVIAGRMGDIRREQDRLVRISGVLFALLIRNPLHEGHVVLGAEQAVRVATDPVVIGDERTRLRAQAGIALLPGSAMTAEDLIRQCELAIDEAGRRDERYVVYTPAINPEKGPDREVWSDIDDALRQGEFEIH
ncbi:MAG: diguanylate cyclase, partial [Gammaproteobacteria bacterium]|nr:diguanylate cyclase [Gammaproteobacteria bacterium]